MYFSSFFNVVSRRGNFTFNSGSPFHFARRLCVLAVCALLLAGCERLFLQPSPPTDNASVFDSMWETIDRRYTFFEFKRIDWDALRARYRARAVAAQSDGELFAVLADALNELQDDHTNLISQFNISRARPFFNDSANFDGEILNRIYLKNQEFISGSLVNAILERGGKKYGYIRYGSFSSPLDTSSWNAVARRFREQKVEGVILDIRNNGGGALANVLFLASRLAKAQSEGLLELVKNGAGRNDYEAPRKIIVRVDTASRAQAYRLVDMRVAVLTDRNSYSASSFLAAIMKAPEFDHVKLIGDHTGGGSGLPVDFQLPNAWTYRFSGTKTLIPAGRVSRAEALAAAPLANHDVDWELGYNFEWGVPVDIRVQMNLADRSRDAILERAMDYLASGR